MDQSHHTPAPWEIVDHWPPNGCGAQIWGDGVHIASLSRALDKPPQQKIADGRLIVSAPRLLEVLKRWADFEGAPPAERHGRALAGERFRLLTETLAAIAEAEAVQ